MDGAPDLGVTWHFVGHLQSNKARKAAQRFDVIHSVDSADLVRRSTRRPMKPAAR